MEVAGRRIRWWLAGVLMVVALGSTTAVVVAHGSERPAAPPATVAVKRGTVTATVSASGTVTPLQSRGLGFSTSGTVTDLNVKAGDVVAAGAVLARIDDTEARDAVDAAQSSVDAAQEGLDRALQEQAAGPATCVAPAGLTLAGLTEAAALTEAVEPAPEPASASASASPRGSPSASASASPSATTRPPTTTSRPPGSAPRPPATGTCARTAGGAAAGSDNLLTAELRLNNAKLALRQAQARLAGTVLTAPIAGKVLSVAGGLGTEASASGSFVVLAGTNDAAVRAQFTEAEVASLAKGQTAKIRLPDRPGVEVAGTVTQIDPAGTVSNRLVRYAAVIAFDPVPEGLLMGQSANVAVVTAAVDDVLYVPSTAVTARTGTTGVVTIRVGGGEQRRTVELGLRGDTDTEVRGGLAEGDEVLVAGR